MPTSHAAVHTTKADRYLAQLCRHAHAVSGRPGKRLREHLEPGGVQPRIERIESSETHATLQFDLGRCIVHAGSAALTLRVEANDTAALRRIEQLVAADIERFGRRDQVTVLWRTDDVNDIDRDGDHRPACGHDPDHAPGDDHRSSPRR